MDSNESHPDSCPDLEGMSLGSSESVQGSLRATSLRMSDDGLHDHASDSECEFSDVSVLRVVTRCSHFGVRRAEVR